jgi:uncharacterized protein DUF5681
MPEILATMPQEATIGPTDASEQGQEQASPNLTPGNGGVVPPVEHRWPPGVSGNPGGRPKWKPVTDAYRRALEDPVSVDKLAAALVGRWLKGDVFAAKEITDRVEGTVNQKLTIEAATVFTETAKRLSAARAARASRNGNGVVEQVDNDPGEPTE